MFGNILAYAKGNIDLVTADDIKVKVDSRLKKIGLSLIGLPHTEMRSRARLIFKNCQLKIRDKLLDAGCGIGLHGFEYDLKSKADVIGIDFSEEKISNAIKIKESLKSDMHFIVGDITDIPLSDNSFNAIICSEVLEHIKEDKKALKELVRVLKKDGTLILSFPAYTRHSMINMKKFGHVRIGYSLTMIKKMAKDNNLKIESISGYSYNFGKLAWWANEKTFKVPILAALCFPLLYALTFLDILKWGKPNGWVVKFSKM